MIWCLPGFLGRASDWDAFAAAATARGLPAVEAVNLFGRPVTGSLAGWADAFTGAIQELEKSALIGIFLAVLVLS